MKNQENDLGKSQAPASPGLASYYTATATAFTHLVVIANAAKEIGSLSNINMLDTTQVIQDQIKKLITENHFYENAAKALADLERLGFTIARSKEPQEGLFTHLFQREAALSEGSWQDPDHRD